MTVTVPESLKSPQFVLELIALTAINILSVVSGQYETAIIIDAAICGYHVGMQ